MPAPAKVRHNAEPGTGNSVRLRAARPGDRWLILRRILREALDPTSIDWRRFVLAEREDGAVLGFAQIKCLPDNVLEFGSLVVEPFARRKGIGALLVRALVEPRSDPIYLLCAGRRETFYQRLQFERLESHEMPPALHRKWRIGSLFARFMGGSVVAMAYRPNVDG